MWTVEVGLGQGGVNLGTPLSEYWPISMIEQRMKEDEWMKGGVPSYTGRSGDTTKSVFDEPHFWRYSTTEHTGNWNFGIGRTADWCRNYYHCKTD